MKIREYNAKSTSVDKRWGAPPDPSHNIIGHRRPPWPPLTTLRRRESHRVPGRGPPPPPSAVSYNIITANGRTTHLSGFKRERVPSGISTGTLGANGAYPDALSIFHFLPLESGFWAPAVPAAMGGVHANSAKMLPVFTNLHFLE